MSITATAYTMSAAVAGYRSESPVRTPDDTCSDGGIVGAGSTKTPTFGRDLTVVARPAA